jgi:nitrate reductase gamma subunit
MKVILPLVLVLILSFIGYVGGKAEASQLVFAIFIPYAALAIFILGFIYRIFLWGRSPVPFRIPTTCGQQQSLPWIKDSKVENPSTTLGVITRMALEVLFFRSLFRNTRTELVDGPYLAHKSDKWLWLAGLAFHWSFLIIFIRHFRLFLEPVPSWLKVIEAFDGFLQIGVPGLLITGFILLMAVTYLFLRRVLIPKLRFISLPADYFPLYLIIGIALTGIIMRYFLKVDVVHVKGLLLNLLSLNFSVPEGIGGIFFVHLFLVSVLLAYFPFSKLMHLGGVFLSPTRNMANTSRMERHINPWNYPVKVHTYEEYEEEFKQKMKGVGIPLDKEEQEKE